MNDYIDANGVYLPIEEFHLNFLVHKLRTEYGFIESSRKNIPVDKNNNIVPMYTYPCYEYINSIDWKGASVFEYGTGYSSVFWSNKKVNYYGVEDKVEWLQKNKNISLEKEPLGYVNSISKHNKKFDVIVIDGLYRYDCVKPALNNLKNDGIIILDNSDWHKNTKELLDKSNLIPVHFHGFKPLHVDSETTSCYISRRFKKKPISIVPIAGTVRKQDRTDTKQI